MIILKRISTDETVQSWGAVPGHFTCPLGEVNGAQVGWVADDFTLVEVPDAPPSVDLAALKAMLRTQVDFDAARERLKYISPGAGIEMTYLEKHAQAQAVLALGEVAANALTEAERIAQFPTLAASVGIEAPTLYACAHLVSQRYEFYATISYPIETARLAGKKAIADAADAAAAQAAYGAITWP
jgi:hypothetical protein